jgi:hypothetical protein
MAEGDRRTLNVRTSAEFLAAYRVLDARIDGTRSRTETEIRAERGKGAAHESARHARLCHEMDDLVLDELERHWGPHLLDGDGTVPDFPDFWRVMFFGRILRIEYSERAAFKQQ